MFDQEPQNYKLPFAVRTEFEKKKPKTQQQ